jgi:hypothetical protein
MEISNKWRRRIWNILFPVVLLLIAPITSDVERAIGNGSINFFKTIRDGLYYKAAKGDSYADAWVYFFVTLGFVIWLEWMTSSAKTLINEKLQAFTSVEIPKPGEPESQARTEKSLKRYRLIASINQAFLLGLVLNITVDTGFSKYANVSFNQRLTAIGPYIDIQTEKKLKSDWSMMTGKSDYLRIQHFIDSVGNKNKIILPEIDL